MDQNKLEELTLSNSLAIQKVLGAIEVTNLNVSNTDKSVKLLTKDIKESMCAKNDCNDVNDRVISLECKMKELSPFIVITRFPKASALMVVGLYALTVKETRTPILGFFGLL